VDVYALRVRPRCLACHREPRERFLNERVRLSQDKMIQVVSCA